MKIRGETRNSLSKSDITRINKEVTARLYDQAQIKKNYLKLLKERAEREKLKQDDAELTYRPEINPVSTMIAEGRHRDIPLERHLLEEGRKI